MGPQYRSLTMLSPPQVSCRYECVLRKQTASRESWRQYQVTRSASLSHSRMQEQQSAHTSRSRAYVCTNAHTHAHTVGEGASLCSPAVLSDCSVCWATAAVIPRPPATLPQLAPLTSTTGPCWSQYNALIQSRCIK